MKVILSIKPYYANKILNGEKIYELRKSIFKANVDKVIIYASAPISKVVGEFQVDEVLCDSINSLWEKTKDYSCVEKVFFREYFKERDKGYAIKVGKVKRYKTQFNIKETFGIAPPQSFSYIY